MSPLSAATATTTTTTSNQPSAQFLQEKLIPNKGVTPTYSRSAGWVERLTRCGSSLSRRQPCFLRYFAGIYFPSGVVVLQEEVQEAELMNHERALLGMQNSSEHILSI